MSGDIPRSATRARMLALPGGVKLAASLQVSVDGQVLSFWQWFDIDAGCAGGCVLDDFADFTLVGDGSAIVCEMYSGVVEVSKMGSC